MRKERNTSFKIQLILADESRTTPEKGLAIPQYYIIGAAVFDFESVGKISDEVIKIKAANGLAKNSIIKWRCSSGTKNCCDAKKVKQEILNLALKERIKVFILAIHHDVIPSAQKPEDTFQMNLEGLCSVCDQELGVNKEKAIFLYDNVEHITNSMKRMESLFSKGCTKKSFDNLILYGMTSKLMGHINSVADVLLGAWSHCIHHNDTRTASLFKSIKNTAYFHKDFGISFRPMDKKYINARLDFKKTVAKLSTFAKIK